MSEEHLEEARPRRVWRNRVRLSEEERRAALSQLFFEGPELWPYVRRLGVLMGLSIAIATFGIASDSAAVVIGAMLVAPLFTPITALAAALVMGWPGRQATQLAIVAGSAAGAVGLAWLLTRFLPQERLVELPSELLLRTRPTLIDLSIAVAAGAAGAYVTVRTKHVEVLPGVAIAVALVPPLSAIGITLELGEGRLARGALLLFLTNFAAIIFAAAVVFLITGFHATFRPRRLTHRMRVGVLTALAAVVAVAYPLADQSRKVVRDARDSESAHRIVTDWIEDRELTLEQATVEHRGSRVEVVVDLIGSDSPPDPPLLAGRLSDEFGAPVELTVHVTARSETRVRSTDGSAQG